MLNRSNRRTCSAFTNKISKNEEGCDLEIVDEIAGCSRTSINTNGALTLECQDDELSAAQMGYQQTYESERKDHYSKQIRSSVIGGRTTGGGLVSSCNLKDGQPPLDVAQSTAPTATVQIGNVRRITTSDFAKLASEGSRSAAGGAMHSRTVPVTATGLRNVGPNKFVMAGNLSRFLPGAVQHVSTFGIGGQQHLRGAVNVSTRLGSGFAARANFSIPVRSSAPAQPGALVASVEGASSTVVDGSDDIEILKEVKSAMPIRREPQESGRLMELPKGELAKRGIDLASLEKTVVCDSAGKWREVFVIRRDQAKMVQPLINASSSQMNAIGTAVARSVLKPTRQAGGSKPITVSKNSTTFANQRKVLTVKKPMSTTERMGGHTATTQVVAMGTKLTTNQRDFALSYGLDSASERAVDQSAIYARIERGQTYVREKDFTAGFKCGWADCTAGKVSSNITMINHAYAHIVNDKTEELLIDEACDESCFCRHCFRKFSSFYVLQNHVDRVHVSKTAGKSVCYICETAFEDYSAFASHIKRTHCRFDMPYRCGICTFRSSLADDVVFHFQQTHADSLNLMCPLCFLPFQGQVSSRRYRAANSRMFCAHIASHLRKEFPCAQCRLLFVRQQELTKHQQRDHTQPDRDQRSAVRAIPLEQLRPKSLRMCADAKGAVPRRPMRPIEPRLRKSASVCLECHHVMDGSHDYLRHNERCKSCSFQTSCAKSAVNHLLTHHCNTNREVYRRREIVLNSPARCQCGFATLLGNKLARHIAVCPSADGIAYILDAEDHKGVTSTAPAVLLNGLGLKSKANADVVQAVDEPEMSAHFCEAMALLTDEATDQAATPRRRLLLTPAKKVAQEHTSSKSTRSLEEVLQPKREEALVTVEPHASDVSCDEHSFNDNDGIKYRRPRGKQLAAIHAVQAKLKRSAPPELTGMEFRKVRAKIRRVADRGETVYEEITEQGLSCMRRSKMRAVLKHALIFQDVAELVHDLLDKLCDIEYEQEASSRGASPSLMVVDDTDAGLSTGSSNDNSESIHDKLLSCPEQVMSTLQQYPAHMEQQVPATFVLDNEPSHPLTSDYDVSAFADTEDLRGAAMDYDLPFPTADEVGDTDRELSDDGAMFLIADGIEYPLPDELRPVDISLAGSSGGAVLEGPNSSSCHGDATPGTTVTCDDSNIGDVVRQRLSGIMAKFKKGQHEV